MRLQKDVEQHLAEGVVFVEIFLHDPVRPTNDLKIRDAVV